MISQYFCEIIDRFCFVGNLEPWYPDFNETILMFLREITLLSPSGHDRKVNSKW